MKSLLTFALMNSLPFILCGQSDCILLLKQGIFNEISQATNYSDRSIATAEICSAYHQYTLDKSTASANAKYKAIFKGGATYSREEIEIIGKMYCEQNFSLEEAQKIVNSYSRYIDQGLVQSFVRCKEFEKDEEMKFKITPLNEYLGSVTISIEYNGVPSRTPIIGKINFDESKLALSGELPNGEGKLLDKVYDLTIRRKDIQSQPFETPGGQVLSEGTQVTLNFQNKAFTINFPPVYPKLPPVIIRKGIGEITTSLLDESTFQTLYNRDGETWVLADGRSISENTGYGQYLLKQNDELKVPNLCGMFLRGNPEEIKLGVEQNSGTALPKRAFKFEVTNNTHEHTHYFAVGNGSSPERNTDIFGDNRMTTGWNVIEPGNSFEKSKKLKNNVKPSTIEGHVISMPSGGDSETRPVNVTVNYFIRIN